MLSGQESQRLRTYFTSNCMEPSRDLDAYGRAVALGDIDFIMADYQTRLARYLERDNGEIAARAAAADDIFRKHWGPTRVPIFNLILLSTMLRPSAREQHLAIARWLISEANVPVGGTDLSGSTALHHAISTKPSFDAEYAQILFDAGGDVNRRNRYGGTPAHEITMVWDVGNRAVVRKACDALQWFLKHGGNLDIKDMDKATARGNVDISRMRGNPTMASARRELWKIADHEDKRRAELEGRVCTCCGRKARDGVALKVCSGCKSVRYCSPGLSCQKLDWPRHKPACRRVAAGP